MCLLLCDELAGLDSVIPIGVVRECQMLGWIRCSVDLGLLELAQGDSLCVSPIHLATYRKIE